MLATIDKTFTMSGTISEPSFPELWYWLFGSRRGIERSLFEWYIQYRCDRKKFGSQSSDNMDRWESIGGNSQRKERQKTEDPGERKGRKVAKHRVFLYFLLVVRFRRFKKKARESGGCGAIWSDERWQIALRCGAKRIWKSKYEQLQQVRSTFGSWGVQKMHLVVAWSIFWSQTVQSTPASDHF